MFSFNSIELFWRKLISICYTLWGGYIEMIQQINVKHHLHFYISYINIITGFQLDYILLSIYRVIQQSYIYLKKTIMK